MTYSNDTAARPRTARPAARPAAPTAAFTAGLTAGPTAGLAAQGAVLVAIAVTAGLGPAGWAAGLAFGVVTRALLVAGLRRTGRAGLGPADRVTLARTVLVGGVTALAADGPARGVPLPLVVALTGVALALDGVDGQVARRTGTASAFGARFDMEVDAFLILLLSVLLIGPVGPWAVAIGGMRYAFVAAGAVRPWILAPLPPRFARKVVAAVQGVVLVVAVAGVLPGAVTRAAVAAALAALCWSFGRDLHWLARHRATGGRPAGTRPVLPVHPRAAVRAAGAVPGARRPAAAAVAQYGRRDGARQQPVTTG